MDYPPIEYAWRGDVSLAYQIVGSGPVDLIYLQGYLSNIELNWENVALARFLRELGSFSRLIVSDRRGLGLSERFTPVDTSATEVLMDDVKSLTEAVGANRPVIFATGDCGPMALLYAAHYPDRAAALILYGSWATTKKTEETPWGDDEQTTLRESEQVRDSYGTGAWMFRTNPSMTRSEADRKWAARYERLSLTPGAVYTESIRFAETDLRGILPYIQVPTLLIHRTGDPEVPVAASHHLAEHIQLANLVELDGSDHFPWLGDQGAVLALIRDFIGQLRVEETAFESSLSTVLFTDIVGSTEMAARMGDAAWESRLEQHNATLRSVVSRFQGRIVKSTGDGFLITFDSPARAIRAADQAIAAVSKLGLQIRAGCHTGEVKWSEDDLSGVAVNIASRITDLAGPSQLLVSRTVKDLVAGGPFQFAEKGTRTLSGVPGEWQLYEAVIESS